MNENSDNTVSKRSKNPSIWTYSFGERPHTVTAYERPDRLNAVEAKYTDSTLPGRDVNGKRLDRRAKILVAIETVRDAKGKLDARLVAEAKRLVQALHGRILNGQPARPAPAPTLPLRETIFGGFQMALAPMTGKYADTTSRRYAEMCGIRDLLFGITALTDPSAKVRSPRRPLTTTPLLSFDLAWEQWTVSAVRALGRHMADLHKTTGAGGVRRAEVIIDAVFSVASWLRAEGLLGDAVALPPKEWRLTLKKEWEAKTDENVVVSRPRHSEQEMFRIFAALNPSFEDPRTTLAKELDNHLFHTATRRQLCLASGPHGELTVLPMGKRRETKQMAFSSDQRDVFDRAMTTGVLADCELAFNKGEINDYPIFPAGVLCVGRVVCTPSMERLTQPFIDPRVRLVIELGAECRVGQVVRCRRSHLSLPDVPHQEAHSAPPGALGQLVIQGRGKKSGQTLLLTPEQYITVKHSLSEGYLSELEARYKAGLLNDYLIFPAGKLLQGKAKVQSEATPMHRTTVLEFFRELEQLAGVESQPGRGWYGLRRKATDVARRYTSDAKVLNAQGGWKDSRTREDIYQDPNDEAVKIDAALVRRAARLGLPTPQKDFREATK